MTKEDFRIVQTDTNEFHIERRVVDTNYTWWGRRKDVVRWMRCDSAGNTAAKKVVAGGDYYFTPILPPQKPFTSLDDAEQQIERIICRLNNYPKIHDPR